MNDHFGYTGVDIVDFVMAMEQDYPDTGIELTYSEVSARVEAAGTQWKCDADDVFERMGLSDALFQPLDKATDTVPENLVQYQLDHGWQELDCMISDHGVDLEQVYASCEIADTDGDYRLTRDEITAWA